MITVTFADPSAIDRKSVLVEVDGVDVTMLATVEAARVIYVPPTGLKHGEHTVKITAADPTGAPFPPIEWKFKIRRFALFEEASLGGELSSTYEGAVRKPRKEPTDGSGVSHKTETPVHNFQNNLSVRGLLKEGELTANLDANIRYADTFRPRQRPKEATDKVDIANYRIGVTRTPFTFEMGDIVVDEGFFGAPNLSRRGMRLMAKDEGRGLRGQLFGMRFESTQGHDPFFGPEESDSILYGAAAAVSPFTDRELLRLHGMNVRGHRFSTAPGSNVGTIVSGERGDLWSFGTSSTLLGGKVRLHTEIAFSEYDTNTTDEFRDQSDKAYRGRLEGGQDLFLVAGAPLSAQWAAEYSYVGFQFRSPGNPGVQPDREGYNLKLDTVWKFATLAVGYSFFNDNTDRVVLFPRVRTYTWNAALTLAPSGLPMVGFTYQFADQRSFYEPENFGPKRVDNFQNTYGVQTSYGTDKWNVSLGGTYTRFDDVTLTRQAGNKDTWSTQASLSLRPFPSLNLSPSVSYNQIDDHNRTIIAPDNSMRRGMVHTRTTTGTLTVGWELIQKVLNWDTQISGASSESSEDTQDNQTWSGMSRLSWNVGRLITDWGKQTVSLRVNWNRTLDHVVPRDTNEIGVFLILDLLSPYNL
jgi:hypothetical protein